MGRKQGRARGIDWERVFVTRRRIYTEEKAKVVSAVWGTKFIQFLDVLAVLYQDEMKKTINPSYSSDRPGGK